LSTTPTTGSLVVNGGLGVSGDINVGGNIDSPTITSNSITSPSFVSSATQGTAPFTITSTTKVVNLNADLLDGITAAQFLRSDVDDIFSAVLTVDNSGRLIDGTSNASGSALLTTSLEIRNDDTLNVNNNATMFMLNHGYSGVRFRMDHVDKFLHFSSAASGAAGLPTDDDSGAFFQGLKINGNEVWHKGNDINGANGVNAGTFDGLLSTQFLRTDVNGALSGTLTVTSPTGASTLTVGTATVSGTHNINVQGGGVGNDYGYHLNSNPAITSNTSSGTTLDIGKSLFTVQKLYTSGIARVTITNAGTTFSGNAFSNTKFSAPFFESTTTSSAPFTVQSSVKVVNLNSDLLDGFSSDYFARSDGTPSNTFLVGDGVSQDRIGFTHNDSQGNSNIVFNHANGVADVAGNVGRISVNTDATTGAYMRFGVRNNGVAGAVAPVYPLYIYEGNVSMSKPLNVTGNTSITGNINVTGTVDGRDVALDGTKIDNITITQPVNLDTIEARVNALDAAVVLVGTWDVGVTFPTGTPATNAGMSWLVGTGGTIDGVEFTSGDRIVALVQGASTTVYATNWLKLDYTDKVSSVHGRTGNVVISKTDLGIPAVENTKLSTWPGTANITQVGSITSGNWLGTSIPVSHGGTGSTTAASARVSLGLAVGVNIQAHSTILDNTTATYTSALNTKLGIATTFYDNAVFNNSTTTADFITELTAKGAFNGNSVSFKVQGDYAGSSDLVTGHPTIGAIELAGCVIETWGNANQKHIRITRPNTGTGGHGVYEYNDQGITYAPAWREIWTSESDGSGSGLDADKLDGLHASSFLRSDIATIANQTATFNAGLNVPSSITMGNCSIYKSSDLNHIHVNVPTALIPDTTVLANAGGLGTATYRWKDVFAGDGNFSGRISTTSDVVANTGFRVTQTTGTGTGISLYDLSPSINPTYGLMFAKTLNKGTHGFVSGAWATYFTMNNTAGRGWIFTTDAVGTTGNVASISNTGDATFNTVNGRTVATDGAKLDSIETGATADQTAGEILTALKTVDGAGSGLDADTLDGLDSTGYLKSASGAVMGPDADNILFSHDGSGNWGFKNNLSVGTSETRTTNGGAVKLTSTYANTVGKFTVEVWGNEAAGAAITAPLYTLSVHATSGVSVNGNSVLDASDAGVASGIATLDAASEVVELPSGAASAVAAGYPGHVKKADGTWGQAGGAIGGGFDNIFYENDIAITTNYTITANKNAMTAGPITINTGVVVTIPTGSTWTVV